MKWWLLSIEMEGRFFNYTGFAESAVQLLIEVIEEVKSDRINLLFSVEISCEDRENYTKTREKYLTT